MEQKKLTYIVLLGIYAICIVVYSSINANTIVDHAKRIQNGGIILNATCEVDKQENCATGINSDTLCKSYVNCTVFLNKSNSSNITNRGVITSDSNDNAHVVGGIYNAYADYNEKTGEVLRLSWNSLDLIVTEKHVFNTISSIIIALSGCVLLLVLIYETIQLFHKKKEYNEL